MIAAVCAVVVDKVVIKVVVVDVVIVCIVVVVVVVVVTSFAMFAIGRHFNSERKNGAALSLHLLAQS